MLALNLLRENRPERPVRLLGVRVGSFGEAPGRAGEPQPLRLIEGRLSANPAAHRDIG